MDERISAALARVFPHDAGMPARPDTPLASFGPAAAWPLLAQALAEAGITVDDDLVGDDPGALTMRDLERAVRR